MSLSRNASGSNELNGPANDSTTANFEPTASIGLPDAPAPGSRRAARLAAAAITAPAVQHTSRREARAALAAAATSSQPQVTRPEVFSLEPTAPVAPTAAQPVARKRLPLATPWTNPVPLQSAYPITAPVGVVAPREASHQELLARVATAPIDISDLPTPAVAGGASARAAEGDAVAPHRDGAARVGLPPAPVGSVATTELPAGHPVLRAPRTYRKPVRKARRGSKGPVVSPSAARALKPKRPKSSLKQKITSAATIIAVAGFFASVTLPALTTDAQANAALNGALAAKEAATNTLSVAANAFAPEVLQESYTATDASDLEAARANEQMVANFDAYMASGAQELGDDYPWFSQLSDDQGGSLSPLNYYYRECVDFVAWRLNRDAGSTEAPFKWEWKDLTPAGGSAYAWKRNWENHGWPTGSTPKVGAVAWFGFHIAYVSAVNDDGTVLLEEYNFQSDHLYGQRTIPASDVPAYLYAPPA